MDKASACVGPEVCLEGAQWETGLALDHMLMMEINSKMHYIILFFFFFYIFMSVLKIYIK